MQAVFAMCRDLRRETKVLPKPNLLARTSTHVCLLSLSRHSARIVSRFHVCGVISINQGGKDIQEQGQQLLRDCSSVSSPNLAGRPYHVRVAYLRSECSITMNACTTSEEQETSWVSEGCGFVVLHVRKGVVKRK